MNKKFKALIAVILTLITAVSLMSTAAAASVIEENNIPIVYVLGKVDVIYEDRDGLSDDPKNKVLYPVSIDDLDIVESLKTIMPAYAMAFMKEYGILPATEKEKLDAWDAYGMQLYGLIGDIWDDIAMDSNGNARGNTGIIWDWNKNYREKTGKNILTDMRDAYGRYDIYDYTFHYDWRTDMYSIAAQLNAYINDVLSATKSKKCVLISRCYGCNVVAAYIDKYGSSKIDTNILYCSTAAGSIVTSEMFSGKFQLSPEGMSNYLDGFLFGENQNLVTSLIAGNVNLGPESFDTLASIVNKIYTRVSHTTMPKTLVTSFASMPGYWSMVEDEFYNDAKEFVFGDEATGRYKKLVEKIDKYHYTITNNAADIFIKAHNNGMNYANIVKYGSNLAPMIEDCDLLSDGIVEVKNAGFGVTCGKIGDVFSTSYLKKAAKKDTLKYINAEATIDASTCIYPDYTWFAEGIDHFDFPKSVDRLLFAIARHKGQMNVFENVEFPQYMKYEGEGNLLTWAGGLYIDNSRDDTAGTLRKITGIFSMIRDIITRVFRVASAVGTLYSQK